LGYPAGPIIDKLAQEGKNNFVSFPRPMLNDTNYDFSFSGVKTSVLYWLRDNQHLLATNLNDIAASFQKATVDVLVAKTMRAASANNVKDIVCVGGVSANTELRATFATACTKDGMNFFSPRPLFSTDNAAMIAMLGAIKHERGVRSPLSLHAEPRVPLTELATS
jgi:N6-L-threonylcarbamoyladenine synthase